LLLRIPIDQNKALTIVWQETSPMKYLRLVLLSLLLLVPTAVLALYKPARVLFPETFGVSCNQTVCVDDASRRESATALYNAAKAHLEEQHGLVLGKPRIIFCSTKTCQHRFGLEKKAGYTLGTFGIVIAPRGWKEYYVAHELIHYWQAEKFGNLALMNGEPWLIEGMAYALSNDPRKALHEPFESYRQRFREWHHLNAGVAIEKSVGEVL
jgi:hypothetical protein